ncbi:MAG: elongation factor Ts [Chloroflexi bacterium]|nr:elongation factor Ts [Chloroflexota bacterium]
MECKRALEEAKGDMAKAVELLRARGIAQAVIQSHRDTREGLVEAYVHNGSRIGALVELNCETDFVARTAEFRELAHALAMQVAAMAPVYTDRSQVPTEDSRNPEEVCLLQQPWIKDPGRVVRDLIAEVSAKVGENIRVRRFARFALGE